MTPHHQFRRAKTSTDISYTDPAMFQYYMLYWYKENGPTNISALFCPDIAKNEPAVIEHHIIF